MDVDPRALRYRELQSRIGWSEADARRMPLLARLVEPDLPSLIDDLYDAVLRPGRGAGALAAGRPRAGRLRTRVERWVRGLFSGLYDEGYVASRWEIGLRRVAAGLDQAGVIVAVSGLRAGLSRSIRRRWPGDPEEGARAADALGRLLDLEAALIDDARGRGGERAAEARELERRCRILVQNSIDVITAFDARGVVLYQSPSIARLLGRPAEERVGAHAFRDPLVHPDDVEAARSFFVEALARPGAAVTGTFRLRHADGSYRQVEAVGTNLLDDPEVAAITANYRDVTVRARMEEDLRMSEERFRVLVEAAECMIVMLRPDLSVAYFSPFAERLTGYDAAQVRGRDYVRTFLPAAERDGVAAELDRAFAGNPTPGYQNRIVLRDGTVRRMTWSHRVLHDFEGGPALLKVGQDVTDLMRSQERALQAERLAAVGQMVAGIAHESRNALQRGQACLEMLARLVVDRPEEAGLVRRAQAAQDQIHRLYEDVRGYAAPILLARARRDLSECWREAWADLEGERSGRPAVLEEETAGAGLGCLVDPFRMRQVFRNVLENSLAARPGPVRVRIRCAVGRLEGRPSLLVSVLDDGPGFTDEARTNVFEPFFTTKIRGTGLGMAIARRLVEAHGGQIRVGEAPSGAEIVINLPEDPP